MLTKEKATLSILSVLATLVETEPSPAPQTHLWLALQNSGALGASIEDWHTVLALGVKVGAWTHTTETVTLTPQGRELGEQVNTKIGA